MILKKFPLIKNRISLILQTERPLHLTQTVFPSNFTFIVERAADRPEVASSAVFETYPAHKADAPLDSYSIAGTFNLEEQNPDIILSKPQPGMTWSLVDTTKCREVEGNCIPDQRLFNVIHDKREGISCDANELGELSKCKKCNAKKQCAWMSWKCPTEAETPAIDVQDKDLRNCQLCVEFWQSKYRCSNVLAETPWRYTSDSKYQRPQMKDFRLPNIDNL